MNKGWQPPKNQRLLIVCTALILSGAYLVMAASYDGLGFPLDDAWIHLTYARNFARSGRWEFIPGVVSGGSTAPLWTLLLAVGYALQVPYLWWTYGVGVLSFVLVGLMAHTLAQRLWPRLANGRYSLVVLATWPLIWAAVSGMETLLFAGVGLLVLNMLLCYLKRPSDLRFVTALGAISGLLVLVRPDGAVLLLLGFVALAFHRERRWRGVAVYGVAIAAIVVPYFLFNWRISGTIWPNTFYAKQTEYAALLNTPLIPRFLKLLYFTLGGPDSGVVGMSMAHWLLIPGLVAAGWRALEQDWRDRRIFYLIPLLWAGGHVALYAWRLPLAFQHGRYLMASFPVWVLFGLAGWQLLWDPVALPMRIKWILTQVGQLTFYFLLLYFVVLGGRAYAQDVAFIENEMVRMARWVNENVPEDALVAAHDIGALGYFAERPLLDMAGLITPSIIPILNDETEMARYLKNNSVDYVITAPGWPYTEIVKNSSTVPIYSTNYPFTRQNGFNNMTIYLFSAP